MAGPRMGGNAAPTFRNNAGVNRFAGNSGTWRDSHGHFHHGRHFRGGPFFGAYAYTYPYYDDDYYGYDRCGYADPGSWWWQRYCAPYGYSYGY
jgi:hypothetical protein